VNAGLRLQIGKARKYAALIASELAPFCERIEVAGSVRRGCDYVGDIDLVAIPRDMQGLRGRLTRNCIAESVGDENLRVVTSIGVQVDLFLARGAGRDLLNQIPSTWGSVMLCRTGSVKHNIWFVQQAKRKNLTWRIQRGLFTEEGECVASETEEEMFAAVGLKYVAPEKRDR
jgi:DNA polymerase (family 10)